MPIQTIVLTGPTATGKTAWAVALARRFGGEIVSVDSRQVYRGLDIGSGKDLADYGTGVDAVPYHLIDIVEPEETYDLMRFLHDAGQAIETIDAHKKIPILAGGTALYLNALLTGYTLPGSPPNPELRGQLEQKSNKELLELIAVFSVGEPVADPENRSRLIRLIEKSQNLAPSATPVNAQLKPLIIGVYYPRTVVHQRIAQRLDARLATGMIEEVAALHAQGVSWEKLESFGLEYRYVALFLQNKLSQNELREQLLIKIRQFARKQDVWFRKMERNGLVIHWLPGGEPDSACALVEQFLANMPVPEPQLFLQHINYSRKIPAL